MDTEYLRKVETFVRTGADLVSAAIPDRYGEGFPWNGARPLEPGFIPPDREATVTVISWYPNDGDLRGNVDYKALRDRFTRWGRDRTLESYRDAYEDWLASLTAIHFYVTHTLPVIEGLGLTPRDIAWIPLIKVPMRPKARLSDAVVELDREDTWRQIHLLRPRIVWIQGISTTDKWIGTQVREQITERIAVQDINERRTREDQQVVVDGMVGKLRRYLAE